MDDVELTFRLCEILGTVPGWHWRPDGPDYTPSEVGLFYRTVDADAEQGIGVSIYGGSDPTVYSPQRRAQLFFRGPAGDPAGADKLARIAFAILHDRPRGGGLSSIERQSFGQLSLDGNRRQERTDNYLIHLDNLEASS